ncbi:DnaD domain protein [Psychrobacillus sp. NPDC093200]|uniref:DnaD domain protein n=1 Tax=Psychrobacillus sp. NPDC093200 TaxID=3390656 RepID=UPI003D004D16
MANHKEKEWEWKGQRYKAEPGQFVTSLPSIVEKAGKGITIQKVRTALKRFEKFEFLTDESTKQNRLITIVNWAMYQQQENKVTDELTVNQQTTNSQLTANKNVRKKEGNKEDDKGPSNPFQFYEDEGFGTISSFIADQLGGLIDDFGEEKVIQAMKETRLNGSNSLNYTRKILTNPKRVRGENNATDKPSTPGDDEVQSRISAANERRKRLAGIKSN